MAHLPPGSDLACTPLLNVPQVTESNLLWCSGVAVVIKATHHCMLSRGVKKHGADLVTSRMLGVFRDQKKTRDEFLALVNHRSNGY